MVSSSLSRSAILFFFNLSHMSSLFNSGKAAPNLAPAIAPVIAVIVSVSPPWFTAVIIPFSMFPQFNPICNAVSRVEIT